MQAVIPGKMTLALPLKPSVPPSINGIMDPGSNTPSSYTSKDSWIETQINTVWTGWSLKLKCFNSLQKKMGIIIAFQGKCLTSMPFIHLLATIESSPQTIIWNSRWIKIWDKLIQSTQLTWDKTLVLKITNKFSNFNLKSFCFMFCEWKFFLRHLTKQPIICYSYKTTIL